jgi:hypothetical protein
MSVTFVGPPMALSRTREQAYEKVKAEIMADWKMRGSPYDGYVWSSNIEQGVRDIMTILDTLGLVAFAKPKTDQDLAIEAVADAEIVSSFGFSEQGVVLGAEQARKVVDHLDHAGFEIRRKP